MTSLSDLETEAMELSAKLANVLHLIVSSGVDNKGYPEVNDHSMVQLGRNLG